MKQIPKGLLLGFISSFAIASNEQNLLSSVHFVNLTPNIQTVYLGEYVSISILMYFRNLKEKQRWNIPENVALQIHTPLTCPPFTNGKVNLPGGLCHFSLIINGDRIGRIINGFGLYYLYGPKGLWEYLADLHFAVRVIPHPLSIANIPRLNATANYPVYLDLRRYVNYYYENLRAGAWPVANLVPSQMDGLYYDPRLFAIVGNPTRLGIYQFKLAVENEYSRTSLTDLIFEVGINLLDKPSFKTNYLISSAAPGQDYQLNLMDQIKTKELFLPSNPLHFRIDKNEAHPDWLSIGGNESNLLIGTVPLSEAGTTKEIRVIASSNTGGESEPIKIVISITANPALRPQMMPFILERSAGAEFEYDLRKHIDDPAHDAQLRVVIDKIEPEAPWLRLSPTNATAVFAKVPQNLTGQEFQLHLHANTRIGGNSNEIKALLKIAIDEEKQPRFKAANPQLPIAYPGMPFEHDFVAHADIYPDYEDSPYVIELVSGYGNPPWLRIENNKLLSDRVPVDLGSPLIQIFLTIKNTPGGLSEVLSLSLFAMIGRE